MAAIQEKFVDGPLTCDVVEAVVGGQLVEARAASHNAAQRPVGVAAAGSLVVVGVAKIDAQPDDTALTGIPVYPLPKATTVIVEGDVPVTYSATATYGAKLVATANGQVGPAGATPDARTVVGYCSQLGGVTGGQVGRMRILNCS
jgi:hypothetical protein